MNANVTRIGWIGTGRMGFAMAARLLAAGQDVHVWNRTRAKANPLSGAGATIVDSVADLAARDVVFTMVAADADLVEVTIGDGGLLRQSTAPRLLVDSSTVSAETSERIRAAGAERGTILLAAPVSGNPRVVRSGRLSIAVSGPREAADEVEPLLRLIGETVTYVGERDTARLVKLAHNVLLGIVTQSLAEIALLAQKGGVSRAALLEFINSSVLGSTFTRYKTPALVNLDLTPTFTTLLLRKDFDLGLAAARALEVPMPVASTAYQRVQAAIGRGHAEEDFAALLIEQARDAGVEIESENVEVDDGLDGPAPRRHNGQAVDGAWLGGPASDHTQSESP